MASPLVNALAAIVLAWSGLGTASAMELEGMRLDDSAEVAGRSLRLNGAGVGLRMIFKVYAISLYLPERESSAETVLRIDAPRRIVIRMLRDVSGDDFRQAMLESLDRGEARTEAARGMLEIGTRLAAQPSGLRKGDVLTLDWVPAVGTVVELNRKPILAPIPDTRLYGALLAIWIGERATDVGLKSRLLGQPPERHASL